MKINEEVYINRCLETVCFEVIDSKNFVLFCYVPKEKLPYYLCPPFDDLDSVSMICKKN